MYWLTLRMRQRMALGFREHPDRHARSLGVEMDIKDQERG
jgi:hypothetical protein